MLINSPSCPRELEMRSRGRDLCHEEGERLDQHLLPLDDRGLGEDDLESGEVEVNRGAERSCRNGELSISAGSHAASLFVNSVQVFLALRALNNES